MSEHTVYARVERIRDPCTGEHLGTIIWPVGSTLRDDLRFYFDPEKEKRQLSLVPLPYRNICAKLLETRGLLR